MTIPADLNELLTYGAHLNLPPASPDDEGGDLFQCPGCPRCVSPWAVVSTTGLPGDLPPWVCRDCASGPHRLAVAAQAAAEAEGAGPDWSATRVRRDGLLARSDWSQVADAPLTDDQRASWRQYRADLRTITDDFPAPDAVVWPDPPT